MIRRPPRSTLFPTRRSSDLAIYVWELERGKKTWRVPIRGPMITSDDHLMIAMAEAGVGLAYLPEPAVSARLKRGRLRLVLEPFAPRVPGLFLYFPSRT